jgi:AcrR family transcriptional regulator
MSRSLPANALTRRLVTTTSPPSVPAQATPRRRDAAATREALLKAAHSRFIQLGYERTTLRDVAADTGFNIALIKRYFGSKEGLFKAALAQNPRFFGREGDAPHDRAELAEALSRQLTAEAWPEFGDHPVLMLLRDSGDVNVDALRRNALTGISHQILDAAGASDLPDEHARLLRAQLLLALGTGVAVLRSAVGLSPLSEAGAEELAEPLRDVIRALLPPAA